MSIPSMWPEYGKFVDLRQVARATGRLDMGGVDWVYPTTLLPLTGFLMASRRKSLTYVPPMDVNVAGYIRLMIANPFPDSPNRKSYVPNNFLPRNQADADAILSRVMKLQNDGQGIGGQTAFAYLIGELTTNIYEHSEFRNAMVMAQRYGKKRFVEVTFYDDGITIPGSLRKAGFSYLTDLDAIKDAVNGRSSKEDYERGYGLGTNVRMCTDVDGLGGKVLVVSGHGAFEYALEKSEQHLYNLGETPFTLDGTLISIRIPYQSKKVNVYDFTD
jgi:hypothetical protein